MKSVAIILAIIAIIWILNGYTSLYIGNSSKELLGYVDEAKKAVKAEDMYNANVQVGMLRAEWETVESHWEALVDHREIDRIDTLMTHLEAMAGTGGLDDMLPELEELAFFLTHIDDKHRIWAENIF